MEQRLRQNGERPWPRRLLATGIYTLGIALALLLAQTVVALPFRNPWLVIGHLTLRQYNPATDLAKFALLVLLPSILLTAALASRHLRRVLLRGDDDGATKPDQSRDTPRPRKRDRILAPLSMVLILIAALNAPTYNASDRYVDTFHEGESLGTAIGWMAGKRPYRDSVFAHGVIQDPLRSVIAFRFLGKSIGAARTVESLLKLVAFALLFVMLLVIVDGRYAVAHAIFSILTLACLLAPPGTSTKLLIIPPRDITTFLFVIVIFALYRSIVAPRASRSRADARRPWLFLVATWLATAAFAYSVDRGYYLLAAAIVLVPSLLFLLRGQRQVTRCAGASLAGLGLGVATLLLLLQGEFAAFARFVFFEMPRYKELMDGQVYRFLQPAYLAPVALAAANLYWLTLAASRLFARRRVRAGAALETVLRAYLPELTLILLSLLYFRSALGRSDPEHVGYSWLLVALASIRILACHTVRAVPAVTWPHRTRRHCHHLALAALCVAGASRIYANRLIDWNFPYKAADAYFIPRHYWRAIAFVKEQIGANGSFFTMTSEGIWYYFIDRPCPCRFPVAWFAAPRHLQEEIVRDLERAAVQVILLRNPHWANTIDAIANRDRLPLIDRYVRENYYLATVLDGNELWLRRDPR